MSDEDAVSFYFTDLASLNNSRQSEGSVVLSCENLSSIAANFAIPSIDPSVGRFGLVGVQTVRKGRDEDSATVQVIPEQQPPIEQEDVMILLLLFRLVNVGTDLLISLNMPLSAVMEVAPAHGDSISLVEAIPAVSSILSTAAGDLPSSRPTQQLKADFLVTVSALQLFLQHFRVVDWSLFSA